MPNVAKRLRLSVLTLLAAAFGYGIAFAQDEGGSRQVDIYMTVEMVDAQPGAMQMPGETAKTILNLPVRISGVTSNTLSGTRLAVTVTPPEPDVSFDPDTDDACPGDEDKPKVTTMQVTEEQDPTVIEAEVDVNGRFEAEFTPILTGTHEVEAVDASGRHGGKTEFDVDEIEFAEECEDIPEEEIEEAAADLYETVCKMVDELQAKAENLPPSPVKDELKKKLDELEDSGKQALACSEAPIWANGYFHINMIRKTHPAVRAATRPVKDKVSGWARETKQANIQAQRALAQITQGNVVCDQLDIVINGLKFVDFYLGLLIQPAKFLEDWAKENIPTKLVALVPAVAQTPALKDGIELGWKGVLSYEPKLKQGKVKISATGFDRFMAHAKIANGIVAYATTRVFEAFCQTFTGPVSGKMAADFLTDGDIWWQYTIEISGQLTLRYPKGAHGQTVALTGEFVGNATSLKSWDNAVPVMFPGLAQGTVFRTMRIEPFALNSIPGVYSKNFGGSAAAEMPDFNPIKSIIDQGGTIAQLVMTPAFFRVPVRAELTDKTLSLELQPAVVDFDDLRVKVIQIVLPVLSLWPEVIDYALPYKGAHFIMLRAMNDGRVQFDVQRQGETMKISRKFDRERSTAETKGVYSLQVDACNPGC